MKRILVAEDEDVIRDFVVINLRRSGYEVVDVPNGDEALRVFDENGGDFDVCHAGHHDARQGRLHRLQGDPQAARPRSGIIMLSAKSQEMDKVGGPDVRRGRLRHQALWPVGAGGACGRAAPPGRPCLPQSRWKTRTRSAPAPLCSTSAAGR